MAPGIRYDGVSCAFLIERSAANVLVLRIFGTDIGELGDAPMRSLDDCLAGVSPFRATSSAWTRSVKAFVFSAR